MLGILNGTIGKRWGLLALCLGLGLGVGLGLTGGCSSGGDVTLNAGGAPDGGGSPGGEGPFGDGGGSGDGSGGSPGNPGDPGPQWRLVGTFLNLNPDQDGAESAIATDGTRVAVAWMEEDPLSGAYQIYVKQGDQSIPLGQLLGGSLNVDPTHNSYEPFVAYHRGNLWVGWSECSDAIGVPRTTCSLSRAYVRYWNGSEWVDPTGSSLNRDPAKGALVGHIKSDGSHLYLATEEEGDFKIPQIYVKQWDDTNGEWTDLGESLNIDSGLHAEEPKLEIIGGVPNVIWVEESGSGNNLVYVKHWDGLGWVQDGGSLNTGFSQSAENPALANHAGVLHAIWFERVSVNGTPVQRVFVKHLTDGNWIPDPDAGPGGTLNVDPARDASYPRLASDGSALYAVWVEKNGAGDFQVFVKRLQAGVWGLLADSGALGSLNVDVARSASEVAIVAFEGVPFVTWDEVAGSGDRRVYIKVYR